MIDKLLTSQVPLRKLSERFGVSVGALHRHRTKCLREAITRIVNKRIQGGDALLSDVLDKSMRVLSKALDATTPEGLPDHMVQLRAADMLAKIFGLYQQPEKTFPSFDCKDYLSNKAYNRILDR